MYDDEEKNVLQKIGNNIRQMRLEKGFSQEAFADYVGLHRTYMGGVERGERNISLLNLLKILRKLECQPNQVFSGVEI